MPIDFGILEFWGKAGAEDSERAGKFHPVAYHSLDVAACAKAILESRPVTRGRAASLLGVSENDAIQLLVSLIALHDIGKFCPAFQAKRPDLWPVALGAFRPAANSGHTSDGYLLWDQVLQPVVLPKLCVGADDLAIALAPAIFGHHGMPVRCPEVPARVIHGAPCLEAAKRCGIALVDLLQRSPVTIDKPLDTTRLRAASWWVAGLVTLSDWIGSNELWFEYRSPDAQLSLDQNLRAYWEVTQHNAYRAVNAAGLIPPSPASSQAFFASSTTFSTLTPAQEWATQTSLESGRLLMVIEDVTGSGKTEAAQILVHRLMSAGYASGAYWAMPTQATANAMYARQGDAMSALFSADSGRLPSLSLAHGQARLSDRFRASVLGVPAEAGVTESRDVSDAESSSSVACAAFIADDRRTSLLADVGAGTIDQALLGVLPSRFNTLRLFALSEKVLIVDEAHAYDAYVSKELEALLRFHAALGGSAVVLSATLESRERANLMTAWLDSAGDKEVSITEDVAQAYPLATVVSGESGNVEQIAISAAPWSHRRVAVRFDNSEASVVDQVIQAAHSGSSVAWVRNSVGDCLRAAQALRDGGIEPIVFHARFAQCDRQDREREILHLFGRRSTPGVSRRVVVATQVIEQSLDISFDAMFTDVAPVDLLIQRAGRLQRHARFNAEQPGEREPELVILSPLMDEDPPADWLKSLLPATAHVYANTGVVWRTVRALTRAGCIVTPGSRDDAGGVRHLVEAVYGDDFVPPNLVPATGRAEGAANAARATATYGTLDVGDGYNAFARGWVDDMRVPTRLGKEQTVLRLARFDEHGDLAPWQSTTERNQPPWKRWALAEVRVPSRYVPHDCVTAPEHAMAIARVRKTWGKYEQDIPVVPLVNEAGGVWSGRLWRRDGRAIDLRYSIADGLSTG